jgi:DNA polymerase (family 10)
MKNQEIALLFDEIADALELKGELQFKVLAYRKAARALQTLTEDIAVLARENRLRTIPGIGDGTARKIAEYLETGRMKKHAEALQGLSEELLELLKIPGLGPKTLAMAHEKLEVNNMADLKRVIEDGSLASLPGMGAKKVDNLRQGIVLREEVGKRLSLDRAMAVAEEIISHLKQLPEVVEITPAGSLRRGKETIGDVDILVTGADAARIVEHFTRFPETTRIIGAGDTKASIVIGAEPHAVQVDLRVLPEESFGAALQYFTGSKEHNVKLRTLARQQGLKISEYGVFRGEKRIAGRTEEEVYAAMSMEVPAPELREDRGEIEAALEGKLPELIELGDIRGDLHVHTDFSDGAASIEEMAAAARARGYEYLAITDHSVTAAYAGGLSVDRLQRSMEAIDLLNDLKSKVKANEAVSGKRFHILKGAEVDIRMDGKLDYPDRILAQLDIVIASIHSGFKHNVTERICDALANPHVNIIAHPSGRLISRRQGYDVDLEKVLECARKYDKALELNAYPDRLDLNDLWLRKCKEMGIRVAISTDAHAIVDLDWMKYGVAIARRGWLERPDVINCLGLDERRTENSPPRHQGTKNHVRNT